MAWLSGYSKRKKITVQTAYLDAAQTDFPLYVPINADADIGAACLSTGYDVRFTASDGTTELSFERVSFAVAAGAATGIFWVKTALATSPATDIYVYYGNAAAVNVSNPATTFSAYTRVWHLSEAYGTGAGNYKDALGVGNLTLTDADGDSAQGTGISGKCVDLNGDADYLTDADHADHDPGGAMTVEVWANIGATALETGLIVHDYNAYKWLITIKPNVASQANATFYIVSASGTSYARYSADLAGAMHFVSGVYDKSLASNRIKLYVDGAVDKQANGFAEDITSGDEGIVIGRWAGRVVDGLIDEVRYSKDAKSASWIKFVYRNITEADNELTWAAEETSAVTLAVAEMAQAQSMNAPALVQVYQLTPAEMRQLQSMESPALTQMCSIQKKVGATAYIQGPQTLIGYTQGPQTLKGYTQGPQTLTAKLEN